MSKLRWNEHRMKAMMVTYCIVLLVDMVALARWLDWIALPGEVDTIQYIRTAFRTQLDYYIKQVQEYGVGEASPVKEALADFEEKLTALQKTSDIDRVLAAGEGVKIALQKAVAAQIQSEVKDILAGDFSVNRHEGSAELIVSKHGEEVIIEATDPTLQVNELTLQSLAGVDGLEAGSLYFSVQDGGVEVVTEKDLADKEVLLEKEFARLQQVLQQALENAGATQLSGPGIILEANDAAGGFLWDEVVHEGDIRSIVNALFAAGAEGVQIGTERVGATSWVRCVGPVVMVNGRQVGANPITVKAVGQPMKLMESLQDIQEEFSYTGKRLLIRIAEKVTLVPYLLEFVPVV